MLDVIVEDFDGSQTSEQFIASQIDTSIIVVGDERLGEELIATRKAIGGIAPESGGCRELVLVSTREGMGHTDTEAYRWDRYFCFLDRRVATVRVVGWVSDQRLEDYERLARRVASSIRVVDEQKQ